jgi:signal transduction histidine kinase
LDLIHAATVFSGATNLALAFSFLYAWRKILRRRYVALLGIAALFGIAEVLLDLPLHSGHGGATTFFIAALASGLGTVAWAGGAYEFVERRLPVATLTTIFIGLMVWAAVAPEVTHGFLYRESGDALIKGGVGLWLAWTFWRGPPIGVRGVLTTFFALQGLHQLDYPLLADKAWGVITGLAIADFLGITISVFLLIVVIEEARQETLVATESLRRAEAMAEMGELVAGVAHEVRNPLMAISSGLQTLTAVEPELAGRHTEILADVKTAVARLTGLTRDLLVYGKPTDPELQTGDAAGAVRAAAAACAPLAAAAGVRVIIDAAAPLPNIVMDPGRLVQVFVNLVTNAVQHSPSGAEVRVRITERIGTGHRVVECAIADAGPGFPRDLLPHLFHPFASRRPGGTGLGLAIARRLVEQQRGAIAAENAPGGGALVRVTLPAAPTVASRPAA